jgi:GT2 family glycosyltransferase
MLRTQFPRTQLIEAENNGMGAGNNRGLRALNEQAAPVASLILNPDTIVRPGALRHLLEFLRAQPQAGIVAPKLLNPDGSLQHSGFRFPGLTQALFDLFPPPGRFSRLLNSPLNGRYPAGAYAAGRPFQVDHTLGAAFLVRQTALVASGMFDEAFEMYCEEIDWQWRLARAGWERWIVPSAEVIHHGGQSTTQVPLESLRKLWISRRRLYQRYQGPLVNALLSYLVQLAMRQRIRANHRRSQQGQMDADYRAEMNRTLTEIIQVWRSRRAPRVRGDDLPQ